MEEKIGYVMVDSGQVMIGDPCYLSDWKGHEFDGDGKTPDGSWEYSYSGACNATLSPAGAGMLENGSAVALSSGYGDGSYPVYITRNRENRIVSMTVYFDEDPNEDDTPYGDDDDDPFEDEREQDAWLDENDD